MSEQPEITVSPAVVAAIQSYKPTNNSPKYLLGFIEGLIVNNPNVPADLRCYLVTNVKVSQYLSYTDFLDVDFAKRPLPTEDVLDPKGMEKLSVALFDDPDGIYDFLPTTGVVTYQVLKITDILETRYALLGYTDPSSYQGYVDGSGNKPTIVRTYTLGEDYYEV